MSSNSAGFALPALRGLMNSLRANSTASSTFSLLFALIALTNILPERCSKDWRALRNTFEAPSSGSGFRAVDSFWPMRAVNLRRGQHCAPSLQVQLSYEAGSDQLSKVSYNWVAETPASISQASSRRRLLPLRIRSSLLEGVPGRACPFYFPQKGGASGGLSVDAGRLSDTWRIVRYTF